MSTELEARLKEAEAKLSGNAADRAALFGVKDVIDGEIANLKQQIEDGKKPKTMIGDVVLSQNGHKGIVLDSNKGLMVHWEDGLICKANEPHEVKGNPLFNIFDGH